MLFGNSNNDDAKKSNLHYLFLSDNPFLSFQNENSETRTNVHTKCCIVRKFCYVFLNWCSLLWFPIWPSILQQVAYSHHFSVFQSQSDSFLMLLKHNFFFTSVHYILTLCMYVWNKKKDWTCNPSHVTTDYNPKLVFQAFITRIFLIETMTKSEIEISIDLCLACLTISKIPFDWKNSSRNGLPSRKDQLYWSKLTCLFQFWNKQKENTHIHTFVFY